MQKYKVTWQLENSEKGVFEPVHEMIFDNQGEASYKMLDLLPLEEEDPALERIKMEPYLGR